MRVDYLSPQPNRAGYQVSTNKGSGPGEYDEALICYVAATRAS